MYGIQTSMPYLNIIYMFENDVKMYGIQTVKQLRKSGRMFENDVKMYGIQTCILITSSQLSLRMM